MKTETAPELEQAEKKKHGFLRILAILLLLALIAGAAA